MVGEAAVAEEPRVGPPQNAEGPPAPRRTAVIKIEVWGKKKASSKVAKSQGKQLFSEAQPVGGAEEQGQKAELHRQMHPMTGHSGGLWGGGMGAATLRTEGGPRTMF